MIKKFSVSLALVTLLSLHPAFANSPHVAEDGAQYKDNGPRVFLDGIADFHASKSFSDDASEDGFPMGIDGSLGLRIQNYMGNSSYGANFGLKLDSINRNTVVGFRGLRYNVISIFLEDPVFGKLELGTTPTAAAKMRLDASSISAEDGGIDSPWYNYVNFDTLTEHVDSFHLLPRLYTEYSHTPDATWSIQGLRTKSHFPAGISYTSPSYYGLKVSATFAPYHIPSGLGSPLRDVDYANVLAAGLSYENSIENGISIKLAATGETGSHQDKEKYHSLEAWNIGATAEFSGFSIAASYANLNKSGLSRFYTEEAKNLDATPGNTVYWTAGASYNMGPAVLSGTCFVSTKSPELSERENTLKHCSIGTHYDIASLPTASGRNRTLTPYLSWHYVTTEGSKVEADDNNSGNGWIAGLKYSF